MTHCREEGRAAHCLLWWTHDLMNSDDLQKKHVPLEQETDGSTHASVCLCRFSPLKCRLHAAQHLAGNVRPWHSLHIHSIQKDQPGTRLHKESFVLQHMQWISSCTSTTANDGMMIEGKSSSWGALQKPREPHAKHFGQHGSAKEHHWKDSQQPSNPERDKEQSLMLNTTQP